MRGLPLYSPATHLHGFCSLPSLRGYYIKKIFLAKVSRTGFITTSVTFAERQYINMNKLFSKIISAVMSVALLASGGTTSAAYISTDISEPEIVSAVSIDGDTFYKSNGVEQNQLLKNHSKQNVVTNAKINFDKDKSIVNLYLKLKCDDMNYSVLASGIPYAENSVNYSKSVIVDVSTSSDIFTVVFLQLYMDNNQHYYKAIIERNTDGETFIINAKINNNTFSSIYDKAANNFISEDLYFAIVTDLEKSPNYGGMYKSKVAYTVDINDEKKMSSSASSSNTETVQSTRASNNSRAAWVTLFNSIYNNRNNGFQYISRSNVDSSIFTGITATAGKYQWADTSENEFDYIVVRLALYQAATNTYSFYLSLLGSETETEGQNINFKFGMCAKQDETLHVATFRTEYNKSTNKIRYVADYGIKFGAYISMGLENSSHTFRRIERIASIAKNNNAWSLVSFAIGNIKYVGTVASLIEALYNASYTAPTSREWVRNDSKIYNVAVLDAEKNDKALYKNGDYLTLNTYTTTSNAPARFQWGYTCYL